jgi:hypothetical protein
MTEEVFEGGAMIDNYDKLIHEINWAHLACSACRAKPSRIPIIYTFHRGIKAPEMERSRASVTVY